VPLFDLSTILWQERRLLQLMGKGASARFALHLAELDRAIVVDGLARDLDLDAGISLRELAATTPEPWPVVFDEHHDALTAVRGSALPLSLTEFLR
jgi:hypothetical protein